SLFRFFHSIVFKEGPGVGFAGPENGDEKRRQMVQYMLAFDNDLAPIVGQQVTLTATNAAVAGPRIDLMVQRAAAPYASKILGDGATECDLVVRGNVRGEARGWLR